MFIVIDNNNYWMLLLLLFYGIFMGRFYKKSEFSLNDISIWSLF